MYSISFYTDDCTHESCNCIGIHGHSFSCRNNSQSISMEEFLTFHEPNKMVGKPSSTVKFSVGQQSARKVIKAVLNTVLELHHQA